MGFTQYMADVNSEGRMPVLMLGLTGGGEVVGSFGKHLFAINDGTTEQAMTYD